MLAYQVREEDSAVLENADQRVVMHGLTWTDYEKLLDIRGDRPGVRIYFLEGDLEIMSPSDRHEWYKKTLARLVEAYADEIGLELNGYGSLTMRQAPRERGAEPDECYVIGRSGGRPHLAIEVVWTSGGLDKLAIYSGLGVRELWICEEAKKKPHISVFTLRRGRYVRSPRSRVLPGLDLELVTRCLQVPSQSEAVRRLRAALRRGRAT